MGFSSKAITGAAIIGAATAASGHTLDIGKTAIVVRDGAIWVTEANRTPFKLGDTAEAAQLRQLLLEHGDQHEIPIKLVGSGGNAFSWSSVITTKSEKPAQATDQQGMTDQPDQREVRIPSLPNERKTNPIAPPSSNDPKHE